MTFYAAQISGEPTWQKLITEPGGRFVNAWLIAAALAVPWKSRAAWLLEAEGQIVYNFGDQEHWEINVAPIVARWQRFPWSERLATSAAFGLGLSYATEVPEVEIELEGQSQRWLIYWMAEFTAGPPDTGWAVTLRLHHRSDAWGVMGEDGGMNAVGVGVRYAF